MAFFEGSHSDVSPRDLGPHITRQDHDWYVYLRSLMQQGATLNQASLLAGDKYPGQGT
jgi:hypothetical protein